MLDTAKLPVHASENAQNGAWAAGQGTYLGRRWAELCWQGRVQEVLSEIDEQQGRISPPPKPMDEADHPWCVLNRERGYMENNQERTDYPRYRREGLPITISPVELWVKQLNQPVKAARNSRTTMTIPRQCCTSAPPGSMTKKSSSRGSGTGAATRGGSTTTRRAAINRCNRRLKIISVSAPVSERLFRQIGTMVVEGMVRTPSEGISATDGDDRGLPKGTGAQHSCFRQFTN